jgi:hypothetical protein
VFNWLRGGNDRDDNRDDKRREHYIPEPPTGEEDTQPDIPIPPAVYEPGGILQRFTNNEWDKNGKERR